MPLGPHLWLSCDISLGLRNYFYFVDEASDFYFVDEASDAAWDLNFLLPICSEYLPCIKLWYMLLHLPESNADLKVTKQCYLFTFIRLFVFVILVLDDPQHV